MQSQDEHQEHSIAEGFVPTMLELGWALVESKGGGTPLVCLCDFTQANDLDLVTLMFNQYVVNLESISTSMFTILQVQGSNCIVQQDISKLEKI